MRRSMGDSRVAASGGETARGTLTENGCSRRLAGRDGGPGFQAGRLVSRMSANRVMELAFEFCYTSGWNEQEQRLFGIACPIKASIG